MTISALMSSPRGVPLLGDQEPRVCSLPPFDSDASGRNAAKLAEVAGLSLDPWQRLVLEYGLRRRGSKWASFETALIVARQNGKGAVLEALELGTHRGIDAWVGVTEQVHPPRADGIEIAPACVILEPGSAAAPDRDRRLCLVVLHLRARMPDPRERARGPVRVGHSALTRTSELRW